MSGTSVDRPGQGRARMHLGAFLFNLGNHAAGWRHADTPPAGLMDLGFYTHLAQVAERGCLDFVFHSDGVGINDTYAEVVGHTVTIRPEPLTLMGALAAGTSRIGLAATLSTTYHEPYAAARAFATLDHLSAGRAAMNLVTSSTDQEARNHGRDTHMEHGARYARAAEFVDVVRGLWDSWEDGAIVADQATGRFAEPGRIHHLHHHGAYFAVRGPLNVPRPPQGHPVLIQAGTSPDGVALAAAVADLVFTVNADLAEAQARYRALKQAAARAGRAPGAPLVMPGLMPVVAPTRAEAQAEFAALQALVPAELAIPYLSDLVDHDLSRHPVDGPVPDLPAINGGTGRLELVRRLGRDGLTLGEVARRMLLGRGHWTVVGTAADIADEMERWFTGSACDGFNILAPWHPGGLERFVDLVVPELQRRGLFRSAYAGRTLREHLGLPHPPQPVRRHPVPRRGVTPMTLTRRALGPSSAALAAATLLVPRHGRAAPGHETLTVRIARDIRNLDPANNTSGIESNLLKSCMQRLAMGKRGLFEWELDAATRIEKTSPTTILFELKPGLQFTGGYGPLTADDVKFSYERFATAGLGGKAATRAKVWEALERVEVTGPLSGILHLSNPAPTVMTDSLTTGASCICSRRAFEALGPKMTQTIVGSGPYIMESWEPNNRIVLRANPDYAGPRPAFERLVMRPIEDVKTAQLALRAGEIDFTALEPGAIREMRAAGSRVTQVDSINYVWIGMNVEAPGLSDIRVRRAIRLALDTDAIVQAAYNGAAKTIRSFEAPGLLGYWPQAPVYHRDVAAARALLAEAGVKPGQAIKLTHLATPAYASVALVVRAMLADAGLDVQIDARPAATFWSSGDGEAGRGLELSLQRFGGQPDPAFQTQWFVSQQIGQWNWQRWRSPEFDALDREGRSIDDTRRRDEIYIRMQQLMDESAAFIWLTNEVNAYGAAPWLDPAIQPTGDDLQYPLFRPV